MADPIKFIQLDCHLDNKFEMIEAEYGLVGFAIVVKLFQRIGGEQGYYCEWNDRVALLFAKKNGASANVVREVVSAAIREGIFDKGMYEKYGVLTSHGFQKRFYVVAKRREVVFDKPEYVLINCAQKNSVADNSAQNACNQGENVCSEPVSKVKQSKVKLSEGNVSTRASSLDASALETDIWAKYGAEPPKSAYDDDPDDQTIRPIDGIGRGVVMLSNRQISELLAVMSRGDFENYVKQLAHCIAEKGYTVRSHYNTIRRWYKEDMRK